MYERLVPATRIFSVTGSSERSNVVVSTVAPAISKTQADKFYTLDGGYAGTDFSSLPKGTYVVGGKKVMK